MLNLYGSFLNEVMNDERGGEFEERAKAIENSNLNKLQG